MAVAELIAHSSFVSVLIPLIFYFLNFKNATRSLHFIGALLIVSLISDSIGLYLYLHKQPTAYVLNTYYLLMFILLSWFFYELRFKDDNKSLFRLSSVIYVILFG